MQPFVRAARLDEAPAIAGLYVDVADEVVAREPSIRHIPDAGAVKRRYRARVAEEDRAVLVALADGVVVGFADAGLERYEDEGTYARTGVYVHIEELVVSASHRRLGVATALLRAVEEWADDMRAGMVWVDTHRTNAAARSLYDAAGYSEFGIVLKKEL